VRIRVEVDIDYTSEVRRPLEVEVDRLVASDLKLDPARERKISEPPRRVQKDTNATPRVRETPGAHP
jgi:hypothetical protein